MALSVTVAELPGLIEAGKLVFVPGSSGAPLAFMESLQSNLENSRDLRLMTSYVTRVNTLDMAAFHPSAQITGLFMQPGLTNAQRTGRYRHLPLSYAGFTRYLEDHVDVDLLVIQVSPANAQGRCSLGPAVEFVPTAQRKSRRTLALINRQTPYIEGSPSLEYASFDYVCEVDTPLPTYSADYDAGALSIAQDIATLIPHGSALQLGLGKIPTALCKSLLDHKELRLYSGMLSDGFMDLADAGALDQTFEHTACVLLGSQALYTRCLDWPSLRLAGCETTHNPRTLFDLGSFVAVNSALEVDLFGQCNLEHANGRAVSGAGGAPDFARAAKLSAGGLSIVALNSTLGAGKGSRIVPHLASTAITSLSRVDVDYIVTEYGIASLAGASVHERANAIISVAAPEFRADLLIAWTSTCQRL
ncbi:acetyl-CoA hydrolase/transferase family protein [Pseudomonas marginalis]|uniref:acetyl-CoA hydrolase/transferase family protein n=1 Tax=Pseudomonas marginalis TaxID=298 RepID=UPI00248150EF|nr:acetyl-CoA hydrolase/transferase C-terminal domain-containing protein [Pseudomonas marginalis]WGT27970.1 acetyl-CoA hydrolase/transferase C-terminal domain-containing protein [Pseudomonas marginalis]